jgi:hypothetical protein
VGDVRRGGFARPDEGPPEPDAARAGGAASRVRELARHR